MKTLLVAACLLGSAATAIAAVAVAVRRAGAEPDEPPPVTTGVLAPAGEPIAAEALVFRTTAGVVALGPGARRERSAHPRNLRTFRFLRAWPGAPPRIPHGLSAEEFREGTCGTCHLRGGYSIRFAAYAPITPHPELRMCLGCHAVDDGVAGNSSPAADPNARCPQCHGAEGRVRPRDRPTGWEALWFRPDASAAGMPPRIPHDRSLREDCLACHAGPAAVEEIRTTHPERADCRTCHVEIESDPVRFQRTAAESGTGAGS
jgi:hypothetical protein